RRSGTPVAPHRVRERFITMVERVREMVPRWHRSSEGTKSEVTKRALPQRRALLVATGLGAAVLAAGMLWPSGPAEEEARAVPSPAAAANRPTKDASNSVREPQESDETRSGLSGDVLAAL